MLHFLHRKVNKLFRHSQTVTTSRHTTDRLTALKAAQRQLRLYYGYVTKCVARLLLHCRAFVLSLLPVCDFQHHNHTE